MDVDVALGEIVHFLTHDERLPNRTRKAVQFLHGLREQMVQADAHKAKPELFDCPFVAHGVEAYTFKEVRQQFGDGFRDKFWPVFGVRRQLRSDRRTGCHPPPRLLLADDVDSGSFRRCMQPRTAAAAARAAAGFNHAPRARRAGLQLRAAATRTRGGARRTGGSRDARGVSAGRQVR